MIHLKTPLTKEILCGLKAGQEVFLSGVIYTMRDKAHKKIAQSAKPPFDLEGQTIYYMGPTPARPGRVSGSCGPTTSARMDKYTPELIKKGIISIIGKGARGPLVNKSMKDGGVVYFIAYSGLGALIAKCITKSQVFCYKELGAEAVYKLEVNKMPLIVAQDLKGNNIYGG